MKNSQKIDFSEILNIEVNSGTDADYKPPASMFCRASPTECINLSIFNYC